jgi:hypothetical protein
MGAWDADSMQRLGGGATKDVYLIDSVVEQTAVSDKGR